MAREVSQRTQILSFVALLVLAVASFGLSYAHLGALSVPVAVAIAAAKAAVVGLFFMELVKERLSIRATALVAMVLVGTLLAFAVADIDTRATPPLLPPS